MDFKEGDIVTIDKKNGMDWLFQNRDYAVYKAIEGYLKDGLKKVEDKLVTKVIVVVDNHAYAKKIVIAEPHDYKMVLIGEEINLIRHATERERFLFHINHDKPFVIDEGENE